MKIKHILSVLFFLRIATLFSQPAGSWNPFANAIQYFPTESNGYSFGTFSCGATFTATFGIGQTTNSFNMPNGAFTSTNRLIVDITLTNLAFNGTVTVGGSANSVISGSYASFFTWTFAASNRVRGVQSVQIPKANAVTGEGAGLVDVAVLVPNQSNCANCMIIDVALSIPSYIVQTVSQTGDDGEQTDASFNCRSLPIQLFQLNSLSKKSAGLNVEWKTQNESNTDYFEVYRMYHGNQSAWMKVGKVEAAGVSHDEITYNFLDNSYAKAEKIYYRIKQVDQNGSFTYTDIKSIELKENGLVKLSGFPNPIQSSYHLAFNSPSDASIQIEVIDLLGKVAFKQKASAVKGYNQYDLEMKDVAAGTYFVKVSGKEIYQTLTVVKTE